MKTLSAILFSILTLSLQPVFANDETKEIEMLIHAYGKAMNASDVDAVMKLFAKDGVFMPSKQPTASGRDAIKKAYAHEFEKIDLDVKIVIDEVYQDGKLAYVRSRSLGQLTLLATKEQKSTEKYRAFFVLTKINAHWKIKRFMFNFSG